MLFRALVCTMHCAISVLKSDLCSTALLHCLIMLMIVSLWCVCPPSLVPVYLFMHICVWSIHVCVCMCCMRANVMHTDIAPVRVNKVLGTCMWLW